MQENTLTINFAKSQVFLMNLCFTFLLHRQIMVIAYFISACSVSVKYSIISEDAMFDKCELTDTQVNKGFAVTFSLHRRTKRLH
jgi:hypothetical protein